MPNPLDNFEIVEVEQGKLEPKMILAENFYFKYGEKALRVGTELNLQSAFRLNSLTDHQEISRMEGKDKGDPIKVFKRINGAEKGWIESMRSNLLVRETILEEIIKRYREEGITVIREVSEITKPLIKEVLAGQINSRDMILKRTEKHKLLEDLLGSAQFKNRIEEFILKPLLYGFLFFCLFAKDAFNIVFCQFQRLLYIRRDIVFFCELYGWLQIFYYCSFRYSKYYFSFTFKAISFKRRPSVFFITINASELLSCKLPQISLYVSYEMPGYY